MPSSMVHLMAAYAYNPAAPAEFWVGNIAPDSISDWKEKDIFHLRNATEKEQAFNDLAHATDSNDLFAEGMLLHLFVDWKWDESLLQQFKASCDSDRWYLPYRTEMGLLSARLYHDNFWSADVWGKMLACDIAKYNQTQNISNENIVATLKRANNYHVSNPLAKPGFYSVGVVNEFVVGVVEEYRCWRGALNRLRIAIADANAGINMTEHELIDVD